MHTGGSCNSVTDAWSLRPMQISEKLGFQRNIAHFFLIGGIVSPIAGIPVKNFYFSSLHLFWVEESATTLQNEFAGTDWIHLEECRSCHRKNFGK